MSKFKTVIFDMDGTVLNTLDDIAGAVNYIMRKYDFPEHTLDEVRHAVGNGAVVLLSKMLPMGMQQPGFDQIFQEYGEYYQSHCQVLTRPYDGILAVLDDMKSQGIGLAIVSNKGDGAVKELNRLHFGDRISTAVGNREGVRHKPAPDSVLAAMEEIGADASEALYVGDSEVDYETAANAGMACALVSWGYRSREQLEELKPDYLIDDPLELLTIIK